MRILVTGTKGFIGKNLLKELTSDILEINEDIFDSDSYRVWKGYSQL